MLLTLSLLLALAPAPSCEGEGEAFADLDHATAQARAQEHGRLLLLDFTAAWCGPCKRMEKTTWVDETVIGWLADNALAIQIDVDAKPGLARRYGVSAMPTIVAVRGETEVGRVVGYRNAEGLLSWLRGLGDAPAVAAVAAAATDSVDEAVEEVIDVEAVRARAMQAVADGRLDDATTDYVWLWNECLKHKPSWVGVRGSYLANEIGELIERHEPTRAAFASIYDGLTARLDEGADGQAWRDWMVLADKLGRNADVLTWVREHRDENGYLLVSLQPAAGHMPAIGVPSSVVKLLLDEGQPAEAGRVVPDMAALADGEMRMLDMLGRGGERPQMAEMLEGHARITVARLYSAALAADRTDQADAIAGRLLARLDDASSRLALVEAAVQAEAVGPLQARWLSQAEAFDDAEDYGQQLARLQREVALALGRAPVDDELPGEGAFTWISVKEATERTTARGELLLVDFTAEWCGPCKQMETTTWADAEVQRWITEHGLALQVDVDREPAVSQRFGVQAMPTIVALRGGEEVGRVVGYRSAKQFLEWVDSLVDS